MIDGAFAQWLEARGHGSVRIGAHSDYNHGAAPELVVTASNGGGEGWWIARLQLRARADDKLLAEKAAAAAAADILATRYTALVYRDPDDSPADDRTYDVRWIEQLQRPTWIPSQGMGEIAVANFQVYVRESNE